MAIEVTTPPAIAKTNAQIPVITNDKKNEARNTPNNTPIKLLAI
jgi:hypothetical protein